MPYFATLECKYDSRTYIVMVVFRIVLMSYSILISFQFSVNSNSFFVISKETKPNNVAINFVFGELSKHLEFFTLLLDVSTLTSFTY